ncbi:MAG: hypothetical protein IJ272_02560 [Clostridia bacterium]|nr:hypothetical protein [Clostridia bacterium]
MLEEKVEKIISQLKENIKDKEKMIEVCRNTEDVAMEHYYSGRKEEAEHILKMLEE